MRFQVCNIILLTEVSLILTCPFGTKPIPMVLPAWTHAILRPFQLWRMALYIIFAMIHRVLTAQKDWAARAVHLTSTASLITLAASFLQYQHSPSSDLIFGGRELAEAIALELCWKCTEITDELWETCIKIIQSSSVNATYTSLIFSFQSCVWTGLVSH